MKKKFFSTEELDSIKEAVKIAESETSGEIATAFIPESNSYAVYELMFSVMMSFITFLVMLYFINPIENWFKSLFWDYQDVYFYTFLGISNYVLITLFYLLSNNSFIDRLIVPKKVAIKAVHDRAMQYFVESGVANTRDRTGILIFISFSERRVELLADSGIAEKIPQEKWSEIVNHIVTGVKKKNLVSYLNESILECGKLLKIHFPIKEDDTNELSNDIKILEK